MSSSTTFGGDRGMQHRGGKMDSFLNLSTQTQSTATPGEKSYGAGEPSTGSEEAMFNRWIEKANDQMFPRIEVGFVGSRRRMTRCWGGDGGLWVTEFILGYGRSGYGTGDS